MSLSVSIAVYFLIWWLVLFAILPFGIRSQHEEPGMASGTDPGAPVRPRLLAKAIATTIISGVLFGAGHWAQFASAKACVPHRGSSALPVHDPQAVSQRKRASFRSPVPIHSVSLSLHRRCLAALPAGADVPPETWARPTNAGPLPTTRTLSICVGRAVILAPQHQRAGAAQPLCTALVFSRPIRFHCRAQRTAPRFSEIRAGHAPFPLFPADPARDPRRRPRSSRTG